MPTFPWSVLGRGPCFAPYGGVFVGAIRVTPLGDPETADRAGEVEGRRTLRNETDL
ncbi:hypothetical protein GCM10010253_07920 [Streptomyces badius]|uniref:Uncharacterized protein n=1 Tax=Streptomyces badius TaxID=1941 RepID=A0ABQ2SQB4_STRBA|nr:hypothetical protein GCM10010253_07920 [Streptomyces badius]